jgi:hypothetical protein
MGENQIAFFTPMSEVGAADAVRGYSFCTEGSFQASDSVADSTQLVERMPVTLELVTVAPVVETTTTTSTTTTTTEATTTSLVSVVEEANTEGGSFSMNVWLPLLIGGTVVLVGVTFYWRTRERKRGGTTPAGPGGTPSDPGAGHGSPIASTVVGDDHGRCDWALYVNDGGARKLLRPAKGHECCVYDVDISTAVFFHDEALRGRQDAVSPQGAIASPDERLRIPDVGHGLGGGTSLWGWTSARSGPAGRLDWMQGGGDPREKVGRKIDHSDAAQVSQQRTLEEGPEVASHLTHLEYTSVKATLEAGCPDHTNTYSLNGTSEVFVQATQECTNGAPGPECPVELTAAGWVEAALVGDLNYSTSEYAHGDVDEIEGRLQAMREKNRPLAMTDSHDHATRPADTYDSARTGSGANAVDKDAMGFTMLSGVGLDAGTIVPVATWPNTERVTADIYADLDHDVTVDARMARGDCEATACGGHGECLCEPEFKLRVGPTQAKLTVDGQTYNMARPSPEGVWHLT